MERDNHSDRSGGRIGGHRFEEWIKEFSGVIPYAEGLAIGITVDDWLGRLDKGEPIEDVFEGIKHTLAAGEDKYPGIRFFDELRFFAASRLLERSHIRQSAELVAVEGMRDPYAMAIDMEALSGYLADKLGAVGVAIAAAHYAESVQILEHISPEKLLDFRRATRNLFIAKVTTFDDPAVDAVDAEIARGRPDYDPVQDWVQTERIIIPYARWDELAVYVADASLWGGLSLRSRQHIVSALASRQQIIHNAKTITGKKTQVIRDILEAGEVDIPNVPIWDYLRFTLAMSLFEHDQVSKGRALARTINRPIIMGHVVDALLRENGQDQARRLVMDIPDPHVVIGLLLAGPWPDRATPDTLLHEILDTSPEAGKMSKHPPDLRIGCIRALAEIYDGSGRLDDATYLRSRADLLEWQVAKGIVRYKPPKK